MFEQKYSELGNLTNETIDLAERIYCFYFFFSYLIRIFIFFIAWLVCYILGEHLLLLPPRTKRWGCWGRGKSNKQLPISFYCFWKKKPSLWQASAHLFNKCFIANASHSILFECVCKFVNIFVCTVYVHVFVCIC